MQFMEPLPETCPPPAAEEVGEERVVYRMVRDDIPQLSDFASQRALRPVQNFRVDECLARGVSIYMDRDACANLLKLSRFKRHRICRVHLEGGAGRILKTFNNPSHHTWWPYAGYDILSHCEVEP